MYKHHKKRKPDWNKEELTRLYWAEDKSLQQIGDLFGVTRERVKQVMERYSIPRRKTWARQQHRHHRPPFRNLSDYLARGKDNYLTMRKFLPENISCSECGSRQHIHIHHINYPAKALKDIQILCNSCHKIKHGTTGMTYIKQIELYSDFCLGSKRATLSKKYSIKIPSVDKIICKIKNGWQTQRG